MILDTNRNTSPRLERTRIGFITAVAGIMAAIAIYAAPRIVLAQSETPHPEAVATSGANVLRAPDGSTITAPQAVAFASADVDSGEPAAPGDIGPGPKFKPEKHGPADLRPGVAIAPVAPLPPAGIAAASVRLLKRTICRARVGSVREIVRACSPFNPGKPKAPRL